jgi:hypothetical protein
MEGVMIKGTMTEQEVKENLTSRFKGISSSSDGVLGNFLAQSAAFYEQRHKRKLPDSMKAILLQSFNQMSHVLQNQRGQSKEAIMSAVSDISKVDNPITLAFNLMSILIPNFTYTEIMGLQPIPTKESPIFFPQILANESRNNVAKGSVLLGSTNWNESNDFTTNRVTMAMTKATGSKAVSFTAPEGSIIHGTVFIQINISGVGTAFVTDDGEGNLIPVSSFTADPAGTVNYSTGVVAMTLAANATANDTVSIGYRYELTAAMKPAQAVIGWSTKQIRAEPYRIRTVFNMDDFFQVKQVLSGYDIDKVLNTSVAGYINKEISCGVFNDLLLRTDADYSWDSVNLTGVSWALHRLSLVQTFVRGGNGIRKNIARSGGNWVVAGTEWMNFIETLGEDLWKSSAPSEEPIGPYVAGTLCGKFKVIKNQDYPDSAAVMGYKRDDVDASILGGVFIGLYSTNPIAMDDLTTIQGMGTQFGWTKVFDNSLVSLTMV